MDKYLPSEVFPAPCSGVSRWPLNDMTVWVHTKFWPVEFNNICVMMDKNPVSRDGCTSIKPKLKPFSRLVGGGSSAKTKVDVLILRRVN